MSRKYEFKQKPYKHQLEGIRFLLENKWGGALLMEPRTGKTKTTIDYLSILASAGKIDRAVIIAPARVLDVWVEEFHKNCPLLHTVFVWDRNGRRAGPPPPVNPVYQLSVLLVNYDAFATPGKKLASGRRSKASGRFLTRKLIYRWLDGQRAACVLDESHKIKSPSGRAANLIVSMAPTFDYRVILTGTPVTKAKRIFDIYMQWQFLNPDRFEQWPSALDFKNQFGKWTQRNGFPQFLGSKNEEQLKELLYQDSYSVTRAECFDLPPRTNVIQNVTLTSSAAVYDELAAEMVAEIEHGDLTHLTEASIPLTLTLRLSQITGGHVTSTEGDLVKTGTEKEDALKALLEEHLENEEKVVVCARFRADLDTVERLAADLGMPCYSVRGGLKRAEVTDNIRSFREEGSAAVCALNPAAGGLGIDLSTAAHMIWYSLTPSWVDYTQACDRIALSDTATTFTYLLATGTVDHLLYETLQNDGDVAQAILTNPRKVLRSA